jgi:hypothetical protein
MQLRWGFNTTVNPWLFASIIASHSSESGNVSDVESIVFEFEFGEKWLGDKKIVFIPNDFSS